MSVIASRAATNLARNLANGAARRRSTQSLMTLRGEKEAEHDEHRHARRGQRVQHHLAEVVGGELRRSVGHLEQAHQRGQEETDARKDQEWAVTERPCRFDAASRHRRRARVAPNTACGPFCHVEWSC